MDGIAAYLQRLQSVLPELLSASDLVYHGIYSSEESAQRARRRGNCPPYVKLNSRVIRYPKAALIEWLRARGVSCGL